MAATGDEQPDSAAYGIAPLSRYPVSAWEVTRMPAPPMPVPMWFKGSRRPEWVRDEPRVAVMAHVQLPSGALTVVNTHLSFIRGWNARQLRSLRETLTRAAPPLLLMGDLNMPARSATRLTGMRPLATRLTFPADHPAEQLDHLLGRGRLVATRVEAWQLPLSDHRALVVELVEPVDA